MRKTLYLLFIGFVSFLPNYSQKSLTIDLSTSCNISDITNIGEKTYYLFEPSTEAKTIVKSIVDAVGLQSNFELYASDVDNATALDSDGERYILYNEFFINELQEKTQTKWAGYFVLAHEIGHHLNGHTFSIGGERKLLELEADEFGGFVLYKLGATLEEVKAALNTTDQNGSDSHPARSVRLAAAARGWINARDGKGTKKPECEIKNTGNYCIYNNTIKTLEVSLFISETNIKKLKILPGDSQCYHSLTVGTYQYDVEDLTANGYGEGNFENGELFFEKCETKRLDLGDRKVYNTNKGDLCFKIGTITMSNKMEFVIKNANSLKKSMILTVGNEGCFEDLDAGTYNVEIYGLGVGFNNEQITYLIEKFDIKVIAGKKTGKVYEHRY